MNFDEKIKEYARLTVRTCGNVTPGKTVVLVCPVVAAQFGRLIVQEAYDAGARDVIVIYSDEKMSRIRYMNADLSVISSIPAWQAEQRNMYAREGCVSIMILAEDPDAFTGVDDAKLMASAIARRNAFKDYYDATDRGEVRWTLVADPCIEWARKMFPGESDEVAFDHLWYSIFAACRLTDNNTAQKWHENDAVLKSRAKKLNELKLTALKYKNSLGTDFTVGLAPGHIWEGGSEKCREGVDFFANMPTEEIFTIPHRERAEGRVFSSMPLIHQGTLIDKFYLTFKDGRVVDFDARVGKNALERILKTDEGSLRLGEVALVPFNSPISEMNTLFYNTLFDENASCHLALGECYPDTLEGGIYMTEEELIAHGGNRSVNHVDFMIGTRDLSITGILADGSEVAVFTQGNFAF